MMRKWLAVAAGVALAAQAIPAYAGNYDGRWVVDFAGVGSPSGYNQNPGCPALRIVVRIADDKISGDLTRSTNTPTAVENGTGSGAAPVIGSVTPDGTVQARWQKYVITGKLAENSGTVSTTGECGPRAGTATRVQ